MQPGVGAPMSCFNQTVAAASSSAQGSRACIVLYPRVSVCVYVVRVCVGVGVCVCLPVSVCVSVGVCRCLCLYRCLRSRLRLRLRLRTFLLVDACLATQPSSPRPTQRNATQRNPSAPLCSGFPVTHSASPMFIQSTHPHHTGPKAWLAPCYLSLWRVRVRAVQND